MSFAYHFLIFLWIMPLAAEEPWGKDADMTQVCRETTFRPVCPTPILGTISEALVRFHQQVISPCDGPRSHFIPSSSQYAIDAIRKYGFFTGFGMGCDRLMRENKEEWVYRKTVDGAGYSIKYDPVP